MAWNIAAGHFDRAAMNLFFNVCKFTVMWRNKVVKFIDADVDTNKQTNKLLPRWKCFPLQMMSFSLYYQIVFKTTLWWGNSRCLDNVRRKQRFLINGTYCNGVIGSWSEWKVDIQSAGLWQQNPGFSSTLPSMWICVCIYLFMCVCIYMRPYCVDREIESWVIYIHTHTQTYHNPLL